MTAGPAFSDILAAALKGWKTRHADEVVLSLALPVKAIDPFKKLPLLGNEKGFRFLWDEVPGLCIAAAGQSQYFDLSGPRRFELSQCFCDEVFGRLIDLSPEVSFQAKPRILFSFSFYDQTSARHGTHGLAAGVQAVLPKWQLTRDRNSAWLRLNGLATQEADAREFAEEICLKKKTLEQQQYIYQERSLDKNIVSSSAKWQDFYRPSLIRGIELVNNRLLDKLVLAVRHSISFEEYINPLLILHRLRHKQIGSCRFLWQTSNSEAFFGASPERLLSLSNGHLKSDALAGTSGFDDQYSLLSSEKELREHEIVVDSIIQQLNLHGLNAYRSTKPKLAIHGHLAHLHTPISAKVQDKKPLHLVEALHPTPAVAGFPRREAMSWLRALEPFERGNYAAPIGWVDSEGRSEFRVAIRCGYANGNELQLTAGAGLVRGSVVEKELKEVEMKLEVLANQLDLHIERDTNFSMT